MSSAKKVALLEKEVERLNREIGDMKLAKTQDNFSIIRGLVSREIELREKISKSLDEQKADLFRHIHTEFMVLASQLNISVGHGQLRESLIKDEPK